MRDTPATSARIQTLPNAWLAALRGLGRAARQAPRALTRGMLNSIGLLPRPHRCYRRWIRLRLRARREAYQASVTPGLFSLLTPVFDPPLHCLKQLAKSVLAQDYPAFQWVLVDNGCTKRSIRRYLERLARDPRVRLVRLPHNTGIIRGTFAALEQATGKYILPVDHDDRLYPDALRVVAADLQLHGDAALLYSDEDKLVKGKPAHPFFKPDWDPALFLNCCYVSHLSVIHRELALELGAYTDPAAEGCPDWDVYFRFIRAGHVPRHVPEILYSWRVHPQSTASAENRAKPYTIDCQRRLLEHHLHAIGAADRFVVRPNPLYGAPGMWYPARRRVDPMPIHVLLGAKGRAADWQRVLQALAATQYPLMEVQLVGPMTSHGEEQLASWQTLEGPLRVGRLRGGDLDSAAVREYLGQLDATARVVILDDWLLPTAADWPWEASGLFELHPDIAVVGGRVFDPSGLLASAGEIFGVNGFLGCPDRPRKETDRAFPFICQHATDAVSGSFFMTRAGFLLDVVSDVEPRLGMPPSRALLGAWLGAAARRQGLRVVYSPHLVARAQAEELPMTASTEEQLAFLAEHWPLLLDDRHYSRHLSLNARRGYRLAPLGERAVILNQTLGQLAGTVGVSVGLSPDTELVAFIARSYATHPMPPRAELSPVEEMHRTTSLAGTP